MLKIYNTLTRSKQEFVPRQPGKVGMYVCGMTVYDYCHIGHARVMVVFDTVARYLRHSGYELTYVRNVTDIDDKIIQRANDNGEEFTALTERFIAAMHEDEQALAVLPPDIEPRATRSIASIINMIQKLLEREYAYIGSNGDVFYAVNRFQGYGKLSGKNIEDLNAGERVDVDNAKRDPLDFVLWKMAKPGEPYWDSPWGQGRPGWHIECSAMSTCCLGNHFDIHGGGMDLQFPHHENEIAQSEGATGEPFVNYWMHNGFVRVNEEKMSKSLGNFFTVREVLKQYSRPDVIRFFVLSSHYRSPLNYSDQQLDEAVAALTRLYTALEAVELSDQEMELDYLRRFEESMDDDFNTPLAISVLFELANELNKAKSGDDKTRQSNLAYTLKKLGGLLGILQAEPRDWLQGKASVSEEVYQLTIPVNINVVELTEEYINQQIQLRLDAKKKKDWATADRIRDELKQLRIQLKDRPDGTTDWYKE
ncbi:cysteine--tRNA ligase [Methylomonas rapida]|uniref:Cysteine--tRNA ligase n=1 Tax=Methylomonas rapida TaxID=2963939 RepID=A0ABY7GLN9_9GAMM|nr:cysteine--tRNA ligase [Methylomonas rapida]WAR45439.1 cysteine--tRNA ligase [Methylomonas rapida]